MLILADIGALTDTEATAVENWVEARRRAGALRRPPARRSTADDLVPVRLRAGDRALGGALTWSEPAKLAAFPPASPFAGLPIPPDVRVNRQVLAEPDARSAGQDMGRLADGTPLVTGARTAAKARSCWSTRPPIPDWTNLALSGLFVDMLRRITALSEGVSGDMQATTCAPIEVLDGRGQLVPPPATGCPDPRQWDSGPMRWVRVIRRDFMGRRRRGGRST